VLYIDNSGTLIGQLRLRLAGSDLGSACRVIGIGFPVALARFWLGLPLAVAQKSIHAPQNALVRLGQLELQGIALDRVAGAARLLVAQLVAVVAAPPPAAIDEVLIVLAVQPIGVHTCHTWRMRDNRYIAPGPSELVLHVLTVRQAAVCSRAVAAFALLVAVVLHNADTHYSVLPSPFRVQT